MQKIFIAAALAAGLIPAAPALADPHGWRGDNGQHRGHYQNYRGQPRYRTDNGIQYWRGDDGRYRCRRSNGTTGLLIGGVAGALLGRTVDTRAIARRARCWAQSAGRCSAARSIAAVHAAANGLRTLRYRVRWRGPSDWTAGASALCGSPAVSPFPTPARCAWKSPMKPAILVTGGARRIGAAIARHFAAAGWHVVIHYGHARDEAEALARELPSAEIIGCDLADSAAGTAMIADLAARLDDWRVLVNSAAVFRWDGTGARSRHFRRSDGRQRRRAGAPDPSLSRPCPRARRPAGDRAD